MTGRREEYRVQARPSRSRTTPTRPRRDLVFVSGIVSVRIDAGGQQSVRYDTTSAAPARRRHSGMFAEILCLRDCQPPTDGAVPR